MKKSLIVLIAVIMAVTCLFAGCESEPTEPVVTPKVAFVPDEPAAATENVDVVKTEAKEFMTIEFGRYPADELTEKNDADLIAALNKLSEDKKDATTGYFTYEDAEYCKEIKIVKNEETGVDETIITWFKVMPITWYVLDESDGKMFVIAAENVSAVPFNETAEDTNWGISTLRDWLNGLGDYANTTNFYNSAFNDAEKSVILTQEISTEANPDYKTESGDDVKDRVSMLSIEDLKKCDEWSNDCFVADEDGVVTARSCGNTDYALYKGSAAVISYVARNSSWYWLRNSGSFAQNAAYVNELGITMEAGYTVSFPQIGVRPTLVLDTTHLNITEA